MSIDTDFCVKAHQYRTVWDPLPVVTAVYTGIMYWGSWDSCQCLLKTKWYALFPLVTLQLSTLRSHTMQVHIFSASYPMYKNPSWTALKYPQYSPGTFYSGKSSHHRQSSYLGTHTFLKPHFMIFSMLRDLFCHIKTHSTSFFATSSPLQYITVSPTCACLCLSRYIWLVGSSLEVARVLTQHSTIEVLLQTTLIGT